jgi:signal transduction histidine kinase/ligand-binding sensor domain-containing protein/DNA-binding response OmpR family regulator
VRLLTYYFLIAGVSTFSATGAQMRGGTKVLPVIDKQDIRFVTLSSGGEPLKKMVRGITQDNQGFMWIATDDGFFRYDGYTLAPYLHDPANPNTISSDNILSIYKDRSGMLWVSTVFDGLDRLDPASGDFTHYRHEPNIAGSLSSDQVTLFYQDRGGAFWVGTKGGLDRFDSATGTFVHYKHDPRDSTSLSSDEITAIYEDRRGDFWVGTTDGLNLFDRATGKSARFLHDPKDPRSLGQDYVSAIMEDQSGVLWVCELFGEGLDSFDLRTREFTHYSFHREQPSNQNISGLTTIYEDADNNLWLGTVQDGLLELDAERKEFTRYSYSAANPMSLCDSAIDGIFEDTEGLIWLSSHRCASRFQRKPSAFVNYTVENSGAQGMRHNTIASVRTDSRGALWLGTPSGLQMLDPKTGLFALYRHDARDPYSIADSISVTAIREDPSGDLWIGTIGGGLNRFERATGRFRHFGHDPSNRNSLSNDLVNCLLIDHEGALWVGTIIGGLDRFDPRTGVFTNYHHDAGNSRSLSNNNVRAIFEDRAGTLWVGTIGGGLNRLDRASGQFTSYRYNSKDPASLSSDAVDAIHEDRSGTLWIGTRQGLNRMEPSGAFTNFNIRDGLPDAYVEAILEDRHGNLWLGTYNGISCFSPQTRRFRNYSQADGLPGNRFNPAGTEGATQTADGKMIFGSMDGLTVFDPDRLSVNSYLPPVALTDFQLFNKPVGTGGKSPLRAPISATNALVLNHDQSIVTLEFSALSYSAPERNRYRYRLENYETDWNEVDSSRRRTTYTNLPPGHYVFHVQGSNNDLLWNEAGARLAITVLPPWYATWPFRAAVAIALACLIFLVYRLRVRNLQLTAARLERQVADRTLQLKAAKESAESANRAKSAFLSQMSHELRTPLNAILGFANLLREGGVTKKQRADLDIIHRSGEHLLGLIDDVLDVAKIEAGRATVEVAPCDLRRLVLDVTDMIRTRAAEKNLELRIVPSADFPQFVATDAKKLSQMLINLLGNAVKHTRKGSVTLRLDTRNALDPELVLLCFEVQDTGIGIALEDQERIFEPFVQVGDARRQKGTGLGLAITRQFAIMLGGDVRVTSAPGEGSSFRLEIPAKRVGQFDGDAKAVEWSYALAPGQSDYRVLVVDDAAENRELLQRLLEKAGFQARVAEEGAEAVEIFQSWRPHFIWMDLRMPGMDGVEATRRIRASDGGRDVKIVAVTASEYTTRAPQGMDDNPVSKPYRASEIFDCMARQLGLTFRTDGAVPPMSVETTVLRPEALAALPDDLRTELANAVLALDVGRLKAVIARVSERDARLGAALAFHAERVAFTPVFEALQECNHNTL